MSAISHLPTQLDPTAANLSSELDDVIHDFAANDVRPAFLRLCAALERVRSSVSVERWEDVCANVCRTHPLFEILRRDPYIDRTLTKPRGYAGDAVIMDFVYADPPTGYENRIWAACQEFSAHVSARWRRDLLSREIDAAAARRPGGRVLAVACGHLREAVGSHALQDGSIEELVALDQDRDSIDRVRLETAHLPVRPVVASVRDLVRRQIDLGSFDLIYAAGLYDYLDDRVAETLSRRLFSMLNNGGELLVGNFLPENEGRAFMEAFMDWPLICRSPLELAEHGRVVSGSPCEVFADPGENVAFVRIRSSMVT